MDEINLTIRKVKNGWIVLHMADFDEEYIATTTLGFDGVGGIVRDICDREERKCQQIGNIKTP